MKTVKSVIPVDGFIVNETTTPMSVDVHIHGITISVPASNELHELLRERPSNFKLVLEASHPGAFKPESTL